MTTVSTERRKLRADDGAVNSSNVVSILELGGDEAWDKRLKMERQRSEHDSVVTVQTTDADAADEVRRRSTTIGDDGNVEIWTVEAVEDPAEDPTRNSQSGGDVEIDVPT